MAVQGRCPVCQARFRGVMICSRCGADLQPLMVLALEAWRAREGAREAIAAGDFAMARQLSARAQQLCFTERGQRLRLLSEIRDSARNPDRVARLFT